MKPIGTTLIYGAVGSLVTALLLILGAASGALISRNILFMLLLCIYSLFLCRWSKTEFISVLFPLLLLTGVGLFHQHAGSLIFIFCIFSWIRSGICYSKTPLRAVLAEVVTLVGGFGIALFCWSPSVLMFSLSVWLFFLIQTLYFYIVPELAEENTMVNGRADSFERARRELERLLEHE